MVIISRRVDISGGILQSVGSNTSDSVSILTGITAGGVPLSQVSVSFIRYSSPVLFGSNDTGISVVSSVVSVSVAGVASGVVLNPPIQVAFAVPVINGSASYRCAYYDFTALTWLSQGCVVMSMTSSVSESAVITCSCSHLTNFAVLVSCCCHDDLEECYAQSFSGSCSLSCPSLSLYSIIMPNKIYAEGLFLKFVFSSGTENDFLGGKFSLICLSCLRSCGFRCNDRL